MKPNELRIDEPIDNDKTNKFYSSKIVLKNLLIPPQNIDRLVIRDWSFEVCPRLEFSFRDSGVYMDKFPIEDGDVLYIELQILQNDIPIVGEYLIQSHEIINIGDVDFGSCSINLVGILKNQNLTFPLYNRSFSSNSSKQVLENICNQIGYSFESDIDTNDAMNWLQINKTNHDFIKEVLDKSYKVDDDLILGHVNIESVFKHTSLKTILNSEPKFFLQYSQLYTYGETSEELKSLKYNNKSYEAIYYNDYEYYDISTLINQKVGYGSEEIYYDVYNDQIRNITSIDDYIKITNNSLKNKNNIGQITNRNVVRYIDENASGNVFGNYTKSKIQNDRLNRNFFSSYLTVVCKPNVNLKVFDKVLINLPSKESEYSDYVHSGEYIVGGIIHDLDGRAFYTTRLFLYNSGINANKSLIDNYESNLNSK